MKGRQGFRPAAEVQGYSGDVEPSIRRICLDERGSDWQWKSQTVADDGDRGREIAAGHQARPQEVIVEAARMHESEG